MSCEYSKTDIQDLAQLKLGTKYLVNQVERLEYRLEGLEQDRDYYLSKVAKINDKLDNLNIAFTHSRFSYLFKNHYWKITGFILSTATILGALGEYLYRLPPPH